MMRHTAAVAFVQTGAKMKSELKEQQITFVWFSNGGRSRIKKVYSDLNFWLNECWEI